MVETYDCRPVCCCAASGRLAVRGRVVIEGGDEAPNVRVIGADYYGLKEDRSEVQRHRHARRRFRPLRFLWRIRAQLSLGE